MFFVDADCHPQTIEVVRTRAEPLGIDGRRRRSATSDVAAPGCFGVLLQYPGSSGAVRDLPRADRARARAAARSSRSPPTCSRSRCSCRRARWAPTSSSARRSASACRSASAARTPRSSRRRDEYKRTLPGRLVGVSVDARGPHRVPPRAADARAAHPPREGDEQHLHRAGAARGDRRPVRRRTTAPTGLRAIARARAPAHVHARRRASRAGGVEVVHDDVLRHAHRARARARRRDRGRGRGAAHQPARRRRRHARHRARRDDDARRSSTTVCAAFGVAVVGRRERADADAIPPALRRTSEFLTHPVFSAHRSETRCCATCAGSPTATSRSTAR